MNVLAGTNGVSFPRIFIYLMLFVVSRISWGQERDFIIGDATNYSPRDFSWRFAQASSDLRTVFDRPIQYDDLVGKSEFALVISRQEEFSAAPILPAPAGPLMEELAVDGDVSDFLGESVARGQDMLGYHRW